MQSTNVSYDDVRFIKGTTELAVDWISPFLVLHAYQDREAITNQIKYLLASSPETTRLMVAMSEGETGEPTLHAFALAYLNTDNQCYIPQFVVLKGCPKGVSQMLYYKMLLWAESKDSKMILGEALKHIRGFMKRYKFRVLSYAIGTELTDEYQDYILSLSRKEIENGKSLRKQHTESGVKQQPDEVTAGDRGSASEGVPTEFEGRPSHQELQQGPHSGPIDRSKPADSELPWST